jgi:hypothetical protein
MMSKVLDLIHEMDCSLKEISGVLEDIRDRMPTRRDRLVEAVLNGLSQNTYIDREGIPQATVIQSAIEQATQAHAILDALDDESDEVQGRR